MAKFNETVSNIGANPYISPGVRDDATAGLLSNVASIGVKAYTGYQQASLQKEITGIADEYFSAPSQEDINQMGVEVGALEGAFAGQFPDTMEGVKKLEGLNQVFEKKLNTLAAASKQGRMSLEELQTRILSATREAVNRNPMIQQELLSTADKYMELSGLGSFIKAQSKREEDVYKAELDRRKQLEKIAEANNVPNFFNMSNAELEFAVNEELKQNRAADEVDYINKIGAHVTREQFAQWEQTNGDAFQQGHYNRLNVAVQTLFKENNTNNYANVKYAFSELIAGAKADFRSAIPPHLRGEEAAKRRVAEYEKSLDDMQKRLESLGSGEDATKVWSNLSSQYKAMQDVALRQQLNPEKFALMTDFWARVPQSFLVDQNGKDSNNLKDLKAYFSGALNKAFDIPAVAGQLPTADKPNPASKILLNAAHQTAVETGDWKGFKEVVSAYNQGLSQIKDSKSKALFMEQNLDALSKMDLTGLDAEGISQLDSMISAYTSNPNFGVRGIAANMEKYPGTAMDILPDGHILFTGPEKDAFNGAYATKLNKALDVYAKSRGISTKEAAADFYNTFYKDAVVSIQNKDQAYAEYEKGRISLDELNFILKDLDTPKTSSSTAPQVAPPTSSSLKPTTQEERMKAKGRTVKPMEPTPKKETTLPDYTKIYEPEKKVSPEVAKKNKELVAKQRDFIKQAERELVGEGVLDAPLRHMENQEAIVKRAESLSLAYAAGKEPDLAVVQGKERIRVSPKGQWVVYSEGKGKIRFYSPVEKIYVDVPYADVPLLEKWFKLPKEQWKKWEK